MSELAMSEIPLFQVDAFTPRPFAGNPAAVCLLEAPAQASWMQDVATEMQLSETAFLVPRPDAGFDLRWFTPSVEVDLCGHATLASAHVLWEQGRLDPGEVARFHTASGVLTARREDDWIELDFPAVPARPLEGGEAEEVRAGLEDVLGAASVGLGANRMDLLVELATEEEVASLAPDLARLATLPHRGVMVTAAASASREADFVSRFFAPASGVPEDPVTGSAHCCLGPFWAERLGREELIAHQISRRGGVVRVRLAGSRVRLQGQAVTVLAGKLLT